MASMARIVRGRPGVEAISWNVRNVRNVHRFLTCEPLLSMHHTETIGLMILCHHYQACDQIGGGAATGEDSAAGFC
jgi:hypothetical protein